VSTDYRVDVPDALQASRGAPQCGGPDGSATRTHSGAANGAPSKCKGQTVLSRAGIGETMANWRMQFADHPTATGRGPRASTTRMPPRARSTADTGRRITSVANAGRNHACRRAANILSTGRNASSRMANDHAACCSSPQSPVIVSWAALERRTWANARTWSLRAAARRWSGQAGEL